ncbi:MAG: biotin/lipoyl-containing protein [Gemmatimonadota bacterium]|nr:biotin/lipoyl-containing protein [Gemmatimonadota bacterium]
MKYLVTRGDRQMVVDIVEQEEGMTVTVDGEAMELDMTPLDGDATYSLLIDGKSFTAIVLDTSDTCRVAIDGQEFEFDVEEEELARLRSQVKPKHKPGAKEIKAPMPGRVIALEVREGDAVRAGQGVVVMEAMKMENELKAHDAGQIKKIRVSVGDVVNKGDVLLVLEEVENSDAP